MAPAVSREQAIAVGVVAGLAVPVIALSVYNREKTKELVSYGYTSVSTSASAAANKTAEGFRAVQSAASSSYSSVVTSASATWDSIAKKLRLKRVKSFPIVLADEEDVDVAAAVDQSSKLDKKAAKKAGQALDKAVPVQVSAK